MEVIDKARVPIVKLKDKVSGLAFDICFDVESGPVSSAFVRSYVHPEVIPSRSCCLSVDVGVKGQRHHPAFPSDPQLDRQIEQYGMLRPLVLVVKYFLSQRQLNDTYSGGIGSFMLTMMALHIVQQVGFVWPSHCCHHGAPLLHCELTCVVVSPLCSGPHRFPLPR
jgi:non-canonical poly(A) RNA polymerase PAPD5/7